MVTGLMLQVFLRLDFSYMDIEYDILKFAVSFHQIWTYSFVYKNVLAGKFWIPHLWSIKVTFGNFFYMYLNVLFDQ